MSDYSKKKLYTIRPTDSKQTIQSRFDELKELSAVIQEGVYPHIHDVHDTTDLLEKARIRNSFLSPAEFLLIRENILNISELKHQLFPFFPQTPLLAAMVGEVRIPHHLREEIDSAIDEHGAIREDATSKLLEITERIKKVRQNIEQLLQGYLTSPETRRFFQERQITLKDDRYVIPIKQNYKGRIPGIVHAESGSGETLFIEPFSTVSKNNELKILGKEKEKEIKNLLLSLTRRVGESAYALSLIADVLSDFDILLAKQRFLTDYSCSIPELCNGRFIDLKGARHPLIRGNVVPIDFTVGIGSVGVIITGPNTGGKTVALKTVGLFVLLSHSGFPVPAESMRTSLFHSIFVDIGDEQSIQQSLSTFSAHIKHIREIIEHADHRSLVLIDELGAGTDPVEGGAIGKAILDYFIRNNILHVVSTHFSSIKMYALDRNDLEVASVQFDSETCKPMYKLVMGIPGRSNAVEVAQQLGLKQEIIEKTKQFLSDKEKAFDTLFKNLETTELQLSKKKENVEQEEKRLQELTEKHTEELERLREKERFMAADYRREMALLIQGYRKKLEETIREVRSKSASKSCIKAAKKNIDSVEDDFLSRQEEVSIKAPPVKKVVYEPQKGDSVIVEGELGKRIRGSVEEINQDKVTVRAGLLRFSVDRASVYPDKMPEERAEDRWDYEPSEREESVYECDIRGKRLEEALKEVTKFLDNAVLRNMETVSIIHGLGTGALREGVWNLLKNYEYVEHFDYTRPEQGGFGCTIVKLKS